MAERRCFSNKIVGSDAFLEMPLSTQALYFQFGMAADDDGFVNSPKRLVRYVGASEDDFKLLIAKRFIFYFEEGVVVIKHWRMHNSLKNDRLKMTQYPEIAARLYIKDNKSYTDNPFEGGTTLYEAKAAMLPAVDSKRIPDGFQMDSQKKRKEKNLTEEEEEGTDSTATETAKLKYLGGELGKGVVFMTDEQMDDLLNRLSVEEFEEYVSRLADYIISHPTWRSFSHYSTILQWVEDDRALK